MEVLWTPASSVMYTYDVRLRPMPMILLDRSVKKDLIRMMFTFIGNESGYESFLFSWLYFQGLYDVSCFKPYWNDKYRLMFAKKS